MTFITGLIIGLIIGWIIEWVIDLLYWRRDESVMQQRLIEAEEKIRELEAVLAERQSTPVAAPPSPVIREKDNLERINGIGPVFAKRLNNAGIFTFAELAAETPERVLEIINPEEWQKIEPELWLEEARQIAQKANQLIKDK
ncbi:MAG: hypothetical protein KDJ97_24610 [Anaerolineae bacterium]|nr:hypothetical protein [Anaerolineae bacterium]